MRLFATCSIALLLIEFVGCSHGPQQYTVTGEVNYRGKPIEEGNIMFADAENILPTAVGKIENGHYQITTLPGHKQVRITASKKTGKMIKTPMGTTPELIDLIPPQYNSATTLSQTVEPQNGSVFDFHLK
jgi:hypothetical protein